MYLIALNLLYKLLKEFLWVPFYTSGHHPRFGSFGFQMLEGFFRYLYQVQGLQLYVIKWDWRTCDQQESALLTIIHNLAQNFLGSIYMEEGQFVKRVNHKQMPWRVVRTHDPCSSNLFFPRGKWPENGRITQPELGGLPLTFERLPFRDFSHFRCKQNNFHGNLWFD